MPKRLTAFAVFALVVGACGGGGAAATGAPTAAPGEPAATEAAATAAATEAPAETTSGGGGGGGGTSGSDLKALAQQLTPPGATETQHLEATGVYQTYLTTNMSIEQLTAFYDEKAASLPIKEYTKVVSNDSLYIGGSDPPVAIIAAPDTSNPGTTTIVISVGAAT